MGGLAGLYRTKDWIGYRNAAIGQLVLPATHCRKDNMSEAFYGMSTVGKCSRVLSAIRLGTEEPQKDSVNIHRLNHYTQMEAIAAKQIQVLGYNLVDGGKCQFCENKYDIVRYGIHVEINTPLFLLSGHMDRQIEYKGKLYPVEIKSAGKNTMTKFASQKFDAFPSYAGQECCYLEAQKRPGVYWMMDRDTGDNLRYVVNDFNNELDLPGFEKITLPITFEDLVNKLNSIELDVQEGKLSKAEESDDCFWCGFKFLCDKEESKKAVMVSEPQLLDMSKQYKKGLDMEKEAKALKSSAVATLLAHARNNKINKFRTSVLSVSLRGMKTKKWLDEDVIRKNAPADIVRLAERESEPYDDYTIRLVANKKGDEDNG